MPEASRWRAMTSSRPSCSAACREASRPAVKALWDEAETRAGSDFEQLFTHIRAMYRLPEGKVISDIRAIATETAAHSRSSSASCGPRR